MLLEILRDRPCLLVLDNFETLLEPGQQAAQYRPGFEGYNELLRAVGQTGHQSCLMVTSREAPPDWAMLSGGAVRTLVLDGLDVADCQLLLAQKDLSGTAPEWITLIRQYRGNGLALKLVAETIRQVFGGEIAAFLSESSSGAVFGGIRRLVAEQLARSSPLEQRVLQVLAVEREPVTMAQLLTELGARVGRGPLVESMAALRQRALVERAETAGAAFTLQPVLLEYVTDRLVQDVCEEIRRAQPGQLAERPLIKAQANVLSCAGTRAECGVSHSVRQDGCWQVAASTPRFASGIQPTGNCTRYWRDTSILCTRWRSQPTVRCSPAVAGTERCGCGVLRAAIWRQLCRPIPARSEAWP